MPPKVPTRRTVRRGIQHAWTGAQDAWGLQWMTTHTTNGNFPALPNTWAQMLNAYNIAFPNETRGLDGLMQHYRRLWNTIGRANWQQAQQQQQNAQPPSAPLPAPPVQSAQQLPLPAFVPPSQQQPTQQQPQISQQTSTSQQQAQPSRDSQHDDANQLAAQLPGWEDDDTEMEDQDGQAGEAGSDASSEKDDTEILADVLLGAIEAVSSDEE